MAGGAWSFLGPTFAMPAAVVTGVSATTLSARMTGGTASNTITLEGAGLAAAGDAVVLVAVPDADTRAGAHALFGLASRADRYV
jgi:hypothetical protein